MKFDKGIYLLISAVMMGLIGVVFNAVVTIGAVSAVSLVDLNVFSYLPLSFYILLLVIVIVQVDLLIHWLIQRKNEKVLTNVLWVLTTIVALLSFVVVAMCLIIVRLYPESFTLMHLGLSTSTLEYLLDAVNVLSVLILVYVVLMVAYKFFMSVLVGRYAIILSVNLALLCVVLIALSQGIIYNMINMLISIPVRGLYEVVFSWLVILGALMIFSRIENNKV